MSIISLSSVLIVIFAKTDDETKHMNGDKHRE